MKVVAVLRLRAAADPARVRGLMAAQLRATWALHTHPSVRSLERTADHPGVVLTLECGALEDAHALLEPLPLLAAGLLDVVVVPVQAYDGWQQLFRDESNEEASPSQQGTSK